MCFIIEVAIRIVDAAGFYRLSWLLVAELLRREKEQCLRCH
jgi:hypothetical protein